MLTLACGCGGILEIGIIAFLLTTICGWLGFSRKKDEEAQHEHQ